MGHTALKQPCTVRMAAFGLDLHLVLTICPLSYTPFPPGPLCITTRGPQRWLSDHSLFGSYTPILCQMWVVGSHVSHKGLLSEFKCCVLALKLMKQPYILTQTTGPSGSVLSIQSVGGYPGSRWWSLISSVTWFFQLKMPGTAFGTLCQRNSVSLSQTSSLFSLSLSCASLQVNLKNLLAIWAYLVSNGYWSQAYHVFA